jgi:ribosome biogenesis GTPase / thiamine phosphate phosphatase
VAGWLSIVSCNTGVLALSCDTPLQSTAMPRTTHRSQDAIGFRFTCKPKILYTGNPELDATPTTHEYSHEYLNDKLRGVVYKKSTGIYHVRAQNGETLICHISNRLRKVLVYPMRDPSSLGYYKVVDVEDIHTVDPVAIGDEVAYIETNPGEGMIKEVLPRKSKLTRRAAGEKPLEQVIVANADAIIPVMAAAQPRPQWTLMDRYLAEAEASELPATVCITKMDLVRGKKAEREVLEQAEEYRRIGYRVLLTSSDTGEGIDELRDLLKDRLSVFIGKSGVGKSSLLNAMQPGLGIRVNEINTSYGKGRHTTTHLEMHTLIFGGSVVDTPGMKIFGLWNVEEDAVDQLYRDFHPYLGKCKFGASCTHEHEPGCAVKKAVERGEISQRRYDSYQYLKGGIYQEY